MKAPTNSALALILASRLAFGDASPRSAETDADGPSRVPGGPAPRDRAVDLDFGEDFPAPGRPDPAPAPDPDGMATRMPPPPAPSRAWLYWTAGAAALAVGGAAWYLHREAAPAPDPVRNDQVFTDEAE